MKAETSPFLHVLENHMAYPDTLTEVCACVYACPHVGITDTKISRKDTTNKP